MSTDLPTTASSHAGVQTGTSTPTDVDLTITGMTCASCSSRIERKLNKLDGVEASVNLPLEKAHVSYSGPVTVEQLLSTVRGLGYGAEVIEEKAPEGTPDHVDTHDHLSHDVAPAEALKRRALVSLVLTLPVFVLAMVPGIHVPGSAWIQFLLSTPVVLWAAWPFHRAAAINARHFASTMDTLVSVGTLSAYLWSTVAGRQGRARRGRAVVHHLPLRRPQCRPPPGARPGWAGLRRARRGRHRRVGVRRPEEAGQAAPGLNRTHGGRCSSRPGHGRPSTAHPAATPT
jgi:copper chaperone CopZ